MGKIYKAVVLSDFQIPYQDNKAIKVVEKYLADEEFDELVWIGDFLDLDYWGKFNIDLVRKLEGRRVTKDVAVADKILLRQQAIIRKNNPKAKFVMLASNHGVRAEKVVDRFPALEGLIEEQNLLRLKEKDIEYVKCYPNGDVHRIGKRLIATHGIYSGSNAARRHVDMFGENIIHGHTHSVDMASKARWGNGNAIIGTSIGCLCRFDLDYIGNNPKAWSHGFAVVYVKPDGDHTLYTPIIKNYSFVAPNGKYYKA